jgi:hypothetical protein
MSLNNAVLRAQNQAGFGRFILRKKMRCSALSRQPLQFLDSL